MTAMTTSSTIMVSTTLSTMADEVVNSTVSKPVMDPDMQFNEGHVLSIVGYSILMVFSAIGNISVLTLLLRRRGNIVRTRINIMLIHLAIADLLVTFLIMPVEIAWAATVSWKFGDSMCRVTAFFRMFGLYLSSFILICISLDRYHAILRPLHMVDIDRRGRVMITCAWIGATIFALPQAVIFHEEKHPDFPWYKQCITYNTFDNRAHEVIYSVFGMVTMYLIPLIVIVFSYTSILAEIIKRSKENNSSDGDGIRRSSLGFLGRAKIRTLKMTVIIVVVFFVCWAPYYFMSIWYWIDRDSAKQVDQKIQKGLFLFACTNSCANPIVYGLFNIRKSKIKDPSRIGQASSSANTQNSQQTNVMANNGDKRDGPPGDKVDTGGTHRGRPNFYVTWNRHRSGRTSQVTLLPDCHFDL
ncbi:hypothetical protein QAD02_005006, partial [Eretmocerus hayati]